MRLPLPKTTNCFITQYAWVIYHIQNDTTHEHDYRFVCCSLKKNWTIDDLETTNARDWFIDSLEWTTALLYGLHGLCIVAGVLKALTNVMLAQTAGQNNNGYYYDACAYCRAKQQWILLWCVRILPGMTSHVTSNQNPFEVFEKKEQNVEVLMRTSMFYIGGLHYFYWPNTKLFIKIII